MLSKPTLTPELVATLATRVGSELIERRLAREERVWIRKTLRAHGRGRFSVESCLTLALKAMGLWQRARSEYFDVRVEENPVKIANLPRAFDGFRIMQISDLHCDLDPALMDVVEARVGGVKYDAVVFTGDYQESRVMNVALTEQLMNRLIGRLRGERFGVLGNHDFLTTAVALEGAGLPILINEATAIERNGERVWICGVDDPRFFGTHDLASARRVVPSGETTILLAHAPDIWREAERLNFDLMLAGHTHGGQLCLPGGFALAKNSAVSRAFVAGAWQGGRIKGYSSRGTGACNIPARLFCPPEITVHTLHGESNAP